MGATVADDDSSSECEHWPDNASDLKTPAVPAPGYDSHNGLRSHHYYLAAAIKAPSKASSKASTKPAKDCSSSPKIVPTPQPQIIYYQQSQQYAYPQFQQYTYAVPPYAYPAPAYYPYAPQPIPIAQPAVQPQAMADYHIYQPPNGAPAMTQQGNAWIGRTKKQVEEDNSIIAKKVGACDAKKVIPVGIKDDQMLWCVELDESTTLR